MFVFLPLRLKEEWVDRMYEPEDGKVALKAVPGHGMDVSPMSMITVTVTPFKNLGKIEPNKILSRMEEGILMMYSSLRRHNNCWRGRLIFFQGNLTLLQDITFTYGQQYLNTFGLQTKDTEVEGET